MTITLTIDSDPKVYNSSIIKFENTNCNATTNGTHFFITSQYNECNTKIGETTEDIVFSNRVLVDPNNLKENDIIERLENTEHIYPVNCLLRKENVVVVDPGYNLTGKLNNIIPLLLKWPIFI